MREQRPVKIIALPETEPPPLARAIVGAIVFDLTNRRKLRQIWEGIDAEIQAEIVATWEALVQSHLAAVVTTKEEPDESRAAR